MDLSEYKVIGLRRFHDLQPGDKFRAMIHNIRPGEVTIKFIDGKIFTARSMVLPEARIGEESLFSVRESDFEGRIVLEMVKSDPETKKTNMLADALHNAGLSITPETVEMARNIIDSGLPVDARTLHKAAFFAHGTNIQAGPDAVVFLLKENMPATAETLRAMHRVLNDPTFLTRVLQGLGLSFVPLAGPEHRVSFPAYCRRLFSEITRLINLPETSAEMKEVLREAREVLLFISRIRSRGYFQIPFAVPGDDKLRLAEVHSKPPAALASLETSALGRVEVLAQKDGGRLRLEFRGESDEVLKKISEAVPNLLENFTQKGFLLDAPVFKIISEPFTVLTPMPDGEQPKKPAKIPERYTFDIRV